MTRWLRFSQMRTYRMVVIDHTGGISTLTINYGLVSRVLVGYDGEKPPTITYMVDDSANS